MPVELLRFNSIRSFLEREREKKRRMKCNSTGEFSSLYLSADAIPPTHSVTKIRRPVSFCSQQVITLSLKTGMRQQLLIWIVYPMVTPLPPSNNVTNEPCTNYHQYAGCGGPPRLIHQIRITKISDLNRPGPVIGTPLPFESSLN